MKTLMMTESDFNKVVPWCCCLPGTRYFADAMILSEYGSFDIGYNEITDLPKRYQKLVKRD